MSKISQKISTILNVHIPEGKWKYYIEAVDTAGEPTRKHATAILFTICEHLEELEKKIELQKGE